MHRRREELQTHLPSFLPDGSSSSTPTQVPWPNEVQPTKRTSPRIPEPFSALSTSHRRPTASSSGKTSSASVVSGPASSTGVAPNLGPSRCERRKAWTVSGRLAYSASVSSNLAVCEASVNAPAANLGVGSVLVTFVAKGTDAGVSLWVDAPSQSHRDEQTLIHIQSATSRMSWLKSAR